MQVASEFILDPHFLSELTRLEQERRRFIEPWEQFPSSVVEEDISDDAG
jgi:hypothetical protein